MLLDMHCLNLPFQQEIHQTGRKTISHFMVANELFQRKLLKFNEIKKSIYKKLKN